MRREIEFAQAEQATKIRGKYLRALEDEQFDLLPSQTYVKGFLRTYADYLGLDGQLYVDEYNSRFVAGEDRESAPRRSVARGRERRNRRLETNVVLLALAVIAIVTVVVISAWKSSGGGTPRPRTPKRHAAPQAASAVARRTSRSRAVSGLVVRSPSTAAGPPGKILFQGTIDRGRDASRSTGKRFWLNVSSPENLVITRRRQAGARRRATGRWR